MQTNNNTYNLRSKSSKKDNEKYKIKKNNSDDDSSYYSDDDSDYEQGDNIDLDVHEYRKFLNKLYPSTYLSKKIKAGEELKKHIKQDNDILEKISENNDVISSLSDDGDGDSCTSSTTSNTNEDSDVFDTSDYSDNESDYENNFSNEKGKFNIIFTIGAPKNNKSYDEDEYDDEDEDKYDDEDDEDEDEYDDEDEDEYHQDDEKNYKHKKHKPSIKILSKKMLKKENNKSSKQQHESDSDSQEEISKIFKNKKDSKNKVKSSETIIDDKSSKAIREMITIFKKKKGKGCKDVFNKMEEYINQEEEKLKKIQEKEEKKKKSKNTSKLFKLLKGKDVLNDYKVFKSMELKKQKELIKKAKELDTFIGNDKPYRLKLIEAPIPAKYKANAMRKINTLNYMEPGSGEYYKIKQWVDTFMCIPFGVNSNLPINLSDGVDKCNEFMNKSIEILDNAVYGLNDAKMQIMQMMGQWISNPDAVGTAIAIKGPMGTGKTTLVKEGISKILNRPFAFIALGGATDSSFLEGHSYTYEGSIWGKIVDIIIQSKCMNPVIYFDELDKVSDTPKGEEIIGILTHLTDTTQNSQFHDKYFANIDFDLSKALFIFSYNDENKVNPILKDRMYRIETKGYDTKEKVTIARKYLIPSIEKNVNFKEGEINIDNDALNYIIKEYTQEEKGVRNFKRCLEILYTKLNLFRLMKPNTKLFEDIETFDVKLPFVITHNIVEKLLKKSIDETWYHNMYT